MEDEQEPVLPAGAGVILRALKNKKKI